MKDLNDSADIRAYQAGLYGSKRLDDRWHVSGTLSGAYLSFDTRRETATGIARADFDGYGAFAQGEVAYDIKAPFDHHVTLSPYAGIEASYIHHDDYTEDGAGALDLDVKDEGTSQLTSIIGVAISGDYETQDMTLTPSLKLGWAHQYLDQSARQNASFVTAPTAIIDSEGPARDRDAARIGLALDIADTTTDAFTFQTSYDASIANDNQDHTFSARLNYRW